MKYRQIAAIFVILCILLYLGYSYWGWTNTIVLILSIISGVIAVFSVVMMLIKPEKRGAGKGDGASAGR